MHRKRLKVGNYRQVLIMMTEEQAREIAREHADSVSRDCGEVWVQCWEDAYDTKLAQLKRFMVPPTVYDKGDSDD